VRVQRRPHLPGHVVDRLRVAAGVSLFTLLRRMGTSLAMIDAHYGHLAPDAEQQERLLLDGYDERLNRDSESFGH
jgi:hypothetical protein